MSGAYTFVEVLHRLHPRYLFEVVVSSLVVSGADNTSASPTSIPSLEVIDLHVT